jgi:uncharacterized membrane protein
MTKSDPVVEAYLARLRAHVERMSPAEQQAAVDEIRRHIADAMAAGEPSDVVLASLGPPEDLGRAYDMATVFDVRDPPGPSKTAERVFALLAIVALGGLPTFLITIISLSIGTAFLTTGLVMLVAGVAESVGPPIALQMPRESPLVALGVGVALSSTGTAAFVGLAAYYWLIARTVRRFVLFHGQPS